MKPIVKKIAIFVSAVVVLLIAFFINGWLSEKRGESKLLYSIQFDLQQLHPQTPPIQKKIHTDILSKLKSARFDDLLGPELASAALTVGTNRNEGLIVFWVEQSFSVDAIELKLDAQSDSLNLSISEFDAKINKKDNSRGVVFGAEYQWDKGTEIWKQMNQIADTNNVQIRLLTSGKPETPWFNVDLYNLDKQSFTNLNTGTQ